jgi:hypothetical protein
LPATYRFAALFHLLNPIARPYRFAALYSLTI